MQNDFTQKKTALVECCSIHSIEINQSTFSTLINSTSKIKVEKASIFP